MAKKTKNTQKPENKQQKAPKSAPKAPQTPPAAAVEETVETAEIVETPAKKPMTEVKIGELMNGKASSSLDANHRVELNGQIIDLFVKNPNAKNQFGELLCESMTHIAAVGVISAVADEVVNGSSTFALTVKKSNYAALVTAAKDMGIELPPIAALPAPSEETVQLPSTEVKVSEETAAAVAEEAKVANEGDKGKIEIDPVKVAHMSEDDLKKALTYIMITTYKHGKNVKESLVAAVDFMHDYRIEEARQAENSTDAMNAFEDRSMLEWLNDIFQYVEPTVYMRGIGKGMHDLIYREKSPLSAFVIFRQYLTDKETGKPEWDDQSIADAVFAIVKFICEKNIAAEEAAKAALDNKKKGYREIAAKHDEEIKKNKEILEAITNISFDIMENFLHNTDCIVASARGRVWKTFYPEADPAAFPSYKNLYVNIEQRAGIILNLFCAPGNKNQNYSEANITPLEQYTNEEYNAMLENEKAMKLAEKKAASKNDQPCIVGIAACIR